MEKILSRIWREFKDEGIVAADELDESGYDADTSRINNGDGINANFSTSMQCKFLHVLS